MTRMCQTARHGTKLPRTGFTPSTAHLITFLPHLQVYVAFFTGLVGPCISGLFCLHRPLWPPSLTALTLTPVTELLQNKTFRPSEFSFYSSSSLAVLRTQYVHIRHEMEHIYLHCTCGCSRRYVHTHTPTEQCLVARLCSLFWPYILHVIGIH